MEGSRPDGEESVRRLAEMLREAERALDHQVRALEEQDDKSEQLITLGVAAIGGGLALALIALREPSRPGGLPGPVLFGAASLFNLVAIAMFLNSYIGFFRHVEAHVGPSLDWLKDKSNDPEWSLANHYVSLLSDTANYAKHNLARMLHSTRWRRRGLYWLSASISGYLAASLLIRGGAI